MSNFEGKVVLITGAASGFGKLLAEKLSARGARLVLGDLNEAGVKEVADQAGEHAVAQFCDVTKEEQVKRLCELAAETFGVLDIAINNAGMATQMKSLIEITEQEMDLSFNVNAKGVFFGMKHQIPLMLDNGGIILNVASLAGLLAAPKLTPYAAAKHAVVGMTKTAAVEFALNNIRVNAVCPFFSPTPMVEEGVEENVVQLLSQGSPMKRLGTPEEMVNAMLHIVDPDNSYMTGQAISIDGGVAAM